MIEKEVVLQDKERRKATIFYIKANTVKEFFDDADEFAKQLNERTGFDLKIDYDIMVFEMRDPGQIAPKSLSHQHMMQ